jgi:phosphoribosyl-ATP pyrophosphohydrolase
MQGQEPLINLNVGHNVTIHPIETLDELTTLAYKFKNLVQAEPTATVCKLATSVGDLSASVLMGGDTTDEFAEEVADVVIAAFVAAANYGVNNEELKEALRKRIEKQSNQGVKDAFNSMMERRGFNEAAHA